MNAYEKSSSSAADVPVKLPTARPGDAAGSGPASCICGHSEKAHAQLGVGMCYEPAGDGPMSAQDGSCLCRRFTTLPVLLRERVELREALRDCRDYLDAAAEREGFRPWPLRRASALLGRIQ